jgi:protein ImuB
MRLAAVDATALRQGLRPGMTLADARARLPDLVVAAANPAADAALLARLADSCERWTPRTAVDPPDGLLLDITGCAGLFSSEAAMLAEIDTRLGRAGFTARGVIADTPDAAHALARFGRPGVMPPGAVVPAVRALPLAALEQPPATETALSRAGLKTIGAVADRPPAPLVARFGPGLGTRLRRMLGREDARIAPRRPVPACEAARHFLDPVVHLQDVAATLAMLAERVAAELERRGQGGRVFEAALFRTDGVVRRLAVESGRPLRDVRAIMRLFHERLDSLAEPVDPGFGFDLIRLSIPVAEKQLPAQSELEGEARSADMLADLVDRLTTRLGPERVLRFQPCDTHDPDRAAYAVPARHAGPIPWPDPPRDEPPTRPITLIDPPEPIETTAGVPDGPPIRFRWRRVLHDVARAEGPERIAAEWWRAAAPTRDYFRVEDRDGHRFWLFREGLYGSETDRPGWFLHGLFP